MVVYLLVNLKRTRKAKGESQEVVSQKLNIPIGTYRAWEQLKSTPRAKELSVLSTYFDVSIDELMGRTELPEGAIRVKIAKGVWIPVYGSISAGTPMGMIKTKYQAEAPLTLIAKHPKAFWFKVNGDSMDKEVLDESFVMIDPEALIQNGDTVAVIVNGHDAALKVFFETPNSIILSPNSNNPEHKEIIIDKSNPNADAIIIVGKKVWASYPHPDMISYIDESA